MRLPSGSRLLLIMKSSKSRTLLPSPNGMKPLHRLNPSTHGRESKITAAALHSTAFLMVQPVKSVANDTIFWNTAITVDTAANDINRKNSDPTSLPPAILLNTFGSVTKISFGPWPGSILNAKHAGKMIRPAIKATKVSRIVTEIASPIRLRSLPI